MEQSAFYHVNIECLQLLNKWLSSSVDAAASSNSLDYLVDYFANSYWQNNRVAGPVMLITVSQDDYWKGDDIEENLFVNVSRTI